MTVVIFLLYSNNYEIYLNFEKIDNFDLSFNNLSKEYNLKFLNCYFIKLEEDVDVFTLFRYQHPTAIFNANTNKLVFFKLFGELTVKDFFKFLGSSKEAEIYNFGSFNFSLEYLSNLKIRYYLVINIIKRLNLDPFEVGSPSYCVSEEIKNNNNLVPPFKINLDLKIYSKEQFIYKYYFILKNNKNLKYKKDDYIKYKNYINYSYIPNPEVFEFFKKEKINYNVLISDIKKLILKDNMFFRNVQYYLKNTSFLMYLGEDSLFFNLVYGGRLELFKNKITNFSILKGDYLEIDFKDAYYAYFSNKFPVGLPVIKVINSHSFHIKDLCFYKVKCHFPVDSKNIPVLPVKTEEIVFPVGTFVGTYFGEELQLFLSNGGSIVYIYTEISWNSWDFLNLGTLSTLFEEFNSSDYKFYIKKMKTSLWGNFLRNSLDFNTLRITYNSEIDNYEKNSKLGDIYSNYWIGAIITSKCRIDIYKLCLYLLKIQAEILMISTDAVYIYIKDYDEFHKKYIYDFPKKIGKIKQYSDLFFINTRQYFKLPVLETKYTDWRKNHCEVAEVERIKYKFFNTNYDNYKSLHYSLNFKSYKKRIWVDDRKITYPLKVNVDYS